MKLILIRHAESAAVDNPDLWKIPSNSAVALSPKGVKQCVVLASTLDHLFHQTLDDDLFNPVPEVLTSTMLRAKQTHEICESLLSYRTSPRDFHPLSKLVGQHTFLNEMLDWDVPNSNPPRSPAEQYDLWLKDESDNLSMRSWPSMKASVNMNLMNRGTRSPSTLKIIFSHHYPINAILSHYAFKNNLISSQDLANVRHIVIPNAVPVLLGFDTTVDYEGCLHGDHLIASSKSSAVPA